MLFLRWTGVTSAGFNAFGRSASSFTSNSRPTAISAMKSRRRQKGEFAVGMEYSTGSGQPIHLFVAGLGNATLPDTRHSIGQYIINSLSSDLDIRLNHVRGGQLGSKLVSLPSASHPVMITLFKSKQLMNVSGPSIVSNYRTACASTGGIGSKSVTGPGKNLVVLSDSISHVAHKLSARFGGSAQGHNGMKSINECLGGKGDRSFWQFRVGVGRGSPNEIQKDADAVEWVMGPISEREKKFWGVGGGGVKQIINELDKVVKKMEQDATAREKEFEAKAAARANVLAQGRKPSLQDG
ncbi:peptidyl-tRNA hydrolase [Coprinopsis marcescibilis]|uniref:peptidyl-tRNA hydrolase n=1 Tax=Coprinopsis marcescibilis TaxID=230819 RepID=A0A5C3KP83_COPMA|nr:peptidyl-tRNA hydrolase [Coprinopsis marcescibilis]